MENTTKLYVYATSAFSVVAVADGLSSDIMGDIIVAKEMLKDLANPQIVRMIKSLDEESELSVKVTDSKDSLVPQLFKLLDSLDVETVAKASRSRSTSGPRKSSGSGTKATCYTIFADYNLADKDESKVALLEAMKACEMSDDDVKGRRVVQSYMSYYRKDVKNGDITGSKTVYEAAAE